MLFIYIYILLLPLFVFLDFSQNVYRVFTQCHAVSSLCLLRFFFLIILRGCQCYLQILDVIQRRECFAALLFFWLFVSERLVFVCACI